MKKTEDKVKFRLLQDLIRPCVIGLTLGWLFMTYVGSSFSVTGTSMEPTIHDNQRCVLNKTTAFSHRFNRSDIVVVRDSNEDNKFHIKRIVGLPGEVISISGGRIYIDGKELDEPYINCDTQCYNYHVYYNNVVLGEDEYFILGDNRNVSSDSRLFGPIKESQIVGTVIY